MENRRAPPKSPMEGVVENGGRVCVQLWAFVERRNCFHACPQLSMWKVENSVESVENRSGVFNRMFYERMFLMMSSTVSRMRVSLSMLLAASLRE